MLSLKARSGTVLVLQPSAKEKGGSSSCVQQGPGRDTEMPQGKWHAVLANTAVTAPSHLVGAASCAPWVCAPRHAAFISAGRGNPTNPDGKSLGEEGPVGFPAGPAGDAEQLRAQTEMRSLLCPPASPPRLGTACTGGTIHPEAGRCPSIAACVSARPTPLPLQRPASKPQQSPVPSLAFPRQHGQSAASRRDVLPLPNGTAPWHRQTLLSDRSTALSSPTTFSSGRYL